MIAPEAVFDLTSAVAIGARQNRAIVIAFSPLGTRVYPDWLVDSMSRARFQGSTDVA